MANMKSRISIRASVAKAHKLPVAEGAKSYSFALPRCLVPPENLQKVQNRASDYYSLSPNLKDDGVLELSLFDDIDGYWGISAGHFTDALRDNPGATSIHLLINSPGGSVFEGRSIQNILLAFDGDVTASIVGVCASAATLPMMAASHVTMGVGSNLMIHNVMTFAWGNAEELREIADLIEAFSSDIAIDYSDFSGQTLEKIEQMMSDETWMDADAAVEYGFADVVVEKRKRKASSEGETDETNSTEKQPVAMVTTSNEKDGMIIETFNSQEAFQTWIGSLGKPTQPAKETSDE